MKSSTVWRGHSTRPSLPAGTVRKVSGSLPRGRRNRLIMPPAKRNRAFPTGNALLYISLSYADLIASFSSSAILNNVFAICNSRLLPTNRELHWQGASGWAHPVFVFMETHAVPYATSGSFLRTPSAVVSYKTRPANLARTSQLCVPSELFHLPSSASFNTSCPAQTSGNQYPSAGASS